MVHVGSRAGYREDKSALPRRGQALEEFYEDEKE